jgi:hypothetical protein
MFKSITDAARETGREAIRIAVKGSPSTQTGLRFSNEVTCLPELAVMVE